MIVVEGPDGSGKTTLIKEIESTFPVTVAPRVVSKDAEALLDLQRWVEEDNTKLAQGVVYDRHRLISEPIYGPVLRAGAEPGFDNFDWLRTQMALFYNRKPTIIYCLPPKEVVLANFENLPTGATPQQAASIYDLYVARAAIDCGVHRAIRYDYTRGADHVRAVIGYINREEWF